MNRESMADGSESVAGVELTVGKQLGWFLAQLAFFTEKRILKWNCIFCPHLAISADCDFPQTCIRESDKGGGGG